MKKFLLILGILFISVGASSAENSIPVDGVDWGAYMGSMQRKIKGNWNPPKANVSTAVIILYRLDKTGKIINTEITKSSGNKVLDDAAVKALYASSPFGNFPAGCNRETIDVQFMFLNIF